MKNWEILARHKDWVSKCTITESQNSEGTKRRFTATILGWTNFKIWEGETKLTQSVASKVQSTVYDLKQRLERGDKTVLDITGFILK